MKSLSDTSQVRMDVGESPVPLMLFRNETCQTVGGTSSTGSGNPPEQSQRWELGTNAQLQLKEQKQSSESATGFVESGAHPGNDSSLVSPLSSLLKQPVIPQANCHHSQFTSKHVTKISNENCDSDVDIETVPDSSCPKSGQFSSTATQQSLSSPPPPERPAKSVKQRRKTQHVPKDDTSYLIIEHLSDNNVKIHSYNKGRVSVTRPPPELNRRGTVLSRHSKLERGRRHYLYEGYKGLRGLLGLPEHQTVTKVMSIACAVSVIKDLETAIQAQEHIIAEEKKKNTSLRRSLEYIQLQSYPKVILRKL